MALPSGDEPSCLACLATRPSILAPPGMLVTDELGAVTRTVLETTRTLFVWVSARPGGGRARTRLAGDSGAAGSLPWS